MLLRFEVSNHRSIMEPVELSMIAVDEDREAARGFERLDERALTVAGIYGPNASGKSNVVAALVWLSLAVQQSLRGWDEVVPREPFRFTPGPSQRSTYEVDVMVESVRHVYCLEVDDSAVMFEGLYSYPERRRRVLFEREGMDLHFRRGLGSFIGTRELLTPTTLALSAAMRLDEQAIAPVGRYLSRIAPVGLRYPARRRGLYMRPMTAPRMSTDLLFGVIGDDDALTESPTGSVTTDRDSALALLRFADLGIDDVEVVEEKLDDLDVPATEKGRTIRSLRFLHRVAGEDVAFDLRDESAGTQTWFRLIGPMLGVLQRGAAMVVDEIDASLHPRLSARLLELFKDPTTNPAGAQLIFTTHDTSLLNHLNRDEVWLTEKGGDGATSLTALAEYGGDKVRRSLNLERAYLQGRFGAVPEPDQLLLRHALGLGQSE